MKRLGLLFFIVVLLIGTVNFASADMYVVMRSTGGGSPYTATVTSDSDQIFNKYNPGDKFDTFCIEHNVYYYDGHKYRVTLSDAGSAGPLVNPLQISTAWLYSYYLDNSLTGDLAGYNANQVQNVIWNLQQAFVPLTSAEVTLKGTALAGGLSWGTDFHDVRVMNLHGLTSWDFDPAQSQLIRGTTFNIVPAPGAAILGLFGLGLTGWIRKRGS